MPLYKQHGILSFEEKIPSFHVHRLSTAGFSKLEMNLECPLFWMSLHLHCLWQRRMIPVGGFPRVAGGREGISHHSLLGDLHRMDTLVCWFPERRIEFIWKQSLELSSVY